MRRTIARNLYNLGFSVRFNQQNNNFVYSSTNFAENFLFYE